MDNRTREEKLLALASHPSTPPYERLAALRLLGGHREEGKRGRKPGAAGRPPKADHPWRAMNILTFTGWRDSEGKWHLHKKVDKKI